MARYCKKHSFVLRWRDQKIAWCCENCQCSKINHSMTNRYLSLAKEIGIESADNAYDLDKINAMRE